MRIAIKKIKLKFKIKQIECKINSLSSSSSFILTSLDRLMNLIHYIECLRLFLTISIQFFIDFPLPLMVPIILTSNSSNCFKGLLCVD